MVTYQNDFYISDENHEAIQGGQDGFPYSALDVDIAKSPGKGAPWHWHEAFEMTYVHAGRITLHTPMGSETLNPGDGYFVNAKVLHSVDVLPSDENCRLYAQLFDAEVISSSRKVVREYIQPVEHCFGFGYKALRTAAQPEDKVLSPLRLAFECARQDHPGCEMGISSALIQAWSSLFDLALPTLSTGKTQPNLRIQRLHQMMRYIYSHYSERISVRQIASTAAVCERECYAIFSEYLHSTPVTVLSEYRLKKAAQMLNTSSCSIEQVAEASGFTDASYFSRIFHKAYHCAPSAFRNQSKG